MMESNNNSNSNSSITIIQILNNVYIRSLIFDQVKIIHQTIGKPSKKECDIVSLYQCITYNRHDLFFKYYDQVFDTICQDYSNRKTPKSELDDPFAMVRNGPISLIYQLLTTKDMVVFDGEDKIIEYMVNSLRCKWIKDYRILKRQKTTNDDNTKESLQQQIKSTTKNHFTISIFKSWVCRFLSGYRRSLVKSLLLPFEREKEGGRGDIGIEHKLEREFTKIVMGIETCRENIFNGIIDNYDLESLDMIEESLVGQKEYFLKHLNSTYYSIDWKSIFGRANNSNNQNINNNQNNNNQNSEMVKVVEFARSISKRCDRFDKKLVLACLSFPSHPTYMLVLEMAAKNTTANSQQQQQQSLSPSNKGKLTTKSIKEDEKYMWHKYLIDHHSALQFPNISIFKYFIHARMYVERIGAGFYHDILQSMLRCGSGNGNGNEKRIMECVEYVLGPMTVIFDRNANQPLWTVREIGLELLSLELVQRLYQHARVDIVLECIQPAAILANMNDLVQWIEDTVVSTEYTRRKVPARRADERDTAHNASFAIALSKDNIDALYILVQSKRPKLSNNNHSFTSINLSKVSTQAIKLLIGYYNNNNNNNNNPSLLQFNFNAMYGVGQLDHIIPSLLEAGYFNSFKSTDLIRIAQLSATCHTTFMHLTDRIYPNNKSIQPKTDYTITESVLQHGPLETVQFLNTQIQLNIEIPHLICHNQKHAISIFNYLLDQQQDRMFKDQVYMDAIISIPFDTISATNDQIQFKLKLMDYLWKHCSEELKDMVLTNFHIGSDGGKLAKALTTHLQSSNKILIGHLFDLINNHYQEKHQLFIDFVQPIEPPTYQYSDGRYLDFQLWIYNQYNPNNQKNNNQNLLYINYNIDTFKNIKNGLINQFGYFR
ncbi:hypothetical protein DFA_02436 [Cavenderia fasciculata]|uniref:Uncharacterized protein n=1 Tax=Cavenderia fasciculata TaxID=261658 RepID=F4PZF9_CACFS|nr:uncharacterized protein DFA_02436 [Cavenderia fasciculata]EGG19188.1 hypothetical protein DFA_02436 [Cavenderia fasciculata]|eukprot:XP_004366821.1 hypothetical protein DFA_02436 [Cavenderia fasciculata]